MQGEEFDELLDNLPWRVRNQVLGGDSSSGTVVGVWADNRATWKDNTNRLERFAWWLLLPIVYTWAGVVACIGIAFFFVPPVCIFLLMLAGYPGACHIAWRVSRSTRAPQGLHEEISADPREGAIENQI